MVLNKNNNKITKIVKILDEYTIIINAGTNDGVKLNDMFNIMDKKGDEIIDPETNEVIGYLNAIKDTVKVTEVQEKMCVCSSLNISQLHRNLTVTANALNNFINMNEKKRLNINYDDVNKDRKESDEPIKVGDEVKLIKS